MWVFVTAFSFKATDKVSVLQQGFFFQKDLQNKKKINFLSLGLSQTGTFNNQETLFMLVYVCIVADVDGHRKREHKPL